ncbi:YhjD/YihY/BrkB family envelope integrity protein [Sediminivirga luteola]|uniref:Inner membrane protein YhjD n=1 Tax=Sediminivirga luteola TaxID=1774748 RepID=A0A8J2XKU3_9MICO|nr:YhjD/YihY/BrkB family envelope integrity protein [Sediminivirga luteola]MCI2264223.1 YihY/virulence factor BrkB family protein [Sediminivirga luteola]GGA17232.1 inner membrane protein YhjD [Sediminivirga luteola]
MNLLTATHRVNRLQRLKRRPAVAHALRAASRFGERLGNQFGAAITYFSVLAIIPTIMFAFAGLGFTLDVLRPELLGTVRGWIENATGGNEQVHGLLDNYLANWRAVGIVAVISALYTAQGWIGNLKDAVRTMVRDDVADRQKQSFPVRVVTNVVTLLGVLIGVLVAVALSVLGTSMQSWAVEVLQLPSWVTPLMVIIPLLAAVGALWLIFMWLFTLLPAEPIPGTAKVRGSLLGAVPAAILLHVATLLIDAFSGSPTAALFGPVIAIMLAMNLFARLTLFVAAWLGTYERRSVLDPVPRAELEEDNGAPRANETRDAVVTLVVTAGIIGGTLLGVRRWEERKGDL